MLDVWFIREIILVLSILKEEKQIENVQTRFFCRLNLSKLAGKEKIEKREVEQC